MILEIYFFLNVLIKLLTDKPTLLNFTTEISSIFTNRILENCFCQVCTVFVVMAATALWSVFDVLALSACIRWRTSSAAVTEALITAVTKDNLTNIH